MKRLICLAVVMLFVSMTMWGCGGSAPPVQEQNNSMNLPEIKYKNRLYQNE